MSNESEKEKIRSVLSAYREAIASFEHDKKQHEKVLADSQKLTQQIATLGEPAYDDESGLDRLDCLKRQSAAAAKTLAALDCALSQLGDSKVWFCVKGWDAALTLVFEAYEEMVKEITTKMAPFYASRERARTFANECDKAKAAFRWIDSMRVIMRNMVSQHDVDDQFFGEVVDLLNEAVKAKPALERFFPAPKNSPFAY